MPVPIPDHIEPDYNGKYPFPVSADGEQIVKGDKLYGNDGRCWTVLGTNPGDRYDVVGVSDGEYNRFLRGRWLSIKPPVLDSNFAPQTEEDIYKRYPKSDGEDFKTWLYKYFFPKPQYPDLTPVDFGSVVADGPKPVEAVVNRICYTANGFYFNSSHIDGYKSKSSNWKYRYGQYVRKPYKRDWIVVDDVAIQKGDMVYRKDAPGVYYFEYIDTEDKSEDPIVFIQRSTNSTPGLDNPNYEHMKTLGIRRSALSMEPFEDSYDLIDSQIDFVVGTSYFSYLLSYALDYLNNDPTIPSTPIERIWDQPFKMLFDKVLEHLYYRRFKLKGRIL